MQLVIHTCVSDSKTFQNVSIKVFFQLASLSRNITRNTGTAIWTLNLHERTASLNSRRRTTAVQVFGDMVSNNLFEKDVVASSQVCAKTFKFSAATGKYSTMLSFLFSCGLCYCVLKLKNILRSHITFSMIWSKTVPHVAALTLMFLGKLNTNGFLETHYRCVVIRWLREANASRGVNFERHLNRKLNEKV